MYFVQQTNFGTNFSMLFNREASLFHDMYVTSVYPPQSDTCLKDTALKPRGQRCGFHSVTRNIYQSYQAPYTQIV